MLDSSISPMTQVDSMIPDDPNPCRDLHPDVLVLHSQPREVHDAPEGPVQASPGVPSVPVTISLVQGYSKDDFPPVTPPQQPTCLASSGRASDPCGRCHLESRPWKLTILKSLQEEIIPRLSPRGRTLSVNLKPRN